MSLFDLSLMSVPPEGGTDALAAGVPTSPKDEASPDAFAQLLAAFSSLSGEARSLAVRADEAPEETDGVTEFLAVSPEEWDPIEAASEFESEEDSQDDAIVSNVLATFLMPVPPAETANRRGEELTGSARLSIGSPVVETAVGGPGAVNRPEAAPGLARAASVRSTGATDVLESVFTRKVEGAVPGGPEAPLGAPDAQAPNEASVPGLDGQLTPPPQVSKGQAPTHEAPTSQTASHHSPTNQAPTNRIPDGVELPRAMRAVDRTSSVEKPDALKGTTPPAPDSVGNVSALAASLERGAGSRGEPQADPSSMTPAASPSLARLPQQTVQTFQQAVAAALQSPEVPVSPTAAPPATPTTETTPSDGGGLESQIVQGIRRLWRGGTEEIRVTLRPEYLGALTISLKVDRNVVNAVLHVDEPQVRAWVQAHEGQLRQAMSSQGLSLEQLVVTDERPGRENRGRDAEPRRNRRPAAGTNDEPAPVFEVAV